MKRKQLTTTFNEDLLKSCKKLAIECDCNVNSILELGYEVLNKNFTVEEISKKIKEDKKK